MQLLMRLNYRLVEGTDLHLEKKKKMMIVPDDSGTFQASFATEALLSSNHSRDKNCVKDFQMHTVSPEGFREEKKLNL